MLTIKFTSCLLHIKIVMTGCLGLWCRVTAWVIQDVVTAGWLYSNMMGSLDSVFDIKLEGLSMIQKDIGRAMSFTKYCETRAASRSVFLKLIARSISLSIIPKKLSNFIIIIFRISYFCILTNITDQFFWRLVSSEHNMLKIGLPHAAHSKPWWKHGYLFIQRQEILIHVTSSTWSKPMYKVPFCLETL